MMPIQPISHPITGRPLPRRTTFRRVSDLGLIDDPGPYFETVNDSSSSKTDVRGGRSVRAATPSDTAIMQTSFVLPVRGLNSARKVSAVGIHVSGLRAGDTSGESPSAIFSAQVGLSLTDDRTGQYGGCALGQGPNDDYAYVYNSFTGTYFYLDGSDGQYLDLRTHRSQSYGLLTDFFTNEAIVYTLDHLGEIRAHAVVNAGTMLPDADPDDAQIRPRITVRNAATGGGAVGIKYTRLDVDVWTE